MPPPDYETRQRVIALLKNDPSPEAQAAIQHYTNAERDTAEMGARIKGTGLMSGIEGPGPAAPRDFFQGLSGQVAGAPSAPTTAAFQPDPTFAPIKPTMGGVSPAIGTDPEGYPTFANPQGSMPSSAPALDPNTPFGATAPTALNTAGSLGLRLTGAITDPMVLASRDVAMAGLDPSSRTIDRAAASSLGAGINALGAPVTAPLGVIGGLVEEQKAAGEDIPLGAQIANLPNRGFEALHNVVGKNVTSLTGSETAGTAADIALTAALLGGARRALTEGGARLAVRSEPRPGTLPPLRPNVEPVVKFPDVLFPPRAPEAIAPRPSAPTIDVPRAVRPISPVRPLPLQPQPGRFLPRNSSASNVPEFRGNEPPPANIPTRPPGEPVGNLPPPVPEPVPPRPPKPSDVRRAERGPIVPEGDRAMRPMSSREAAQLGMERQQREMAQPSAEPLITTPPAVLKNIPDKIVRRAGFRDAKDAVETYRVNPADPRFEQLPPAAQRAVEGAHRQLYGDSATPPEPSPIGAAAEPQPGRPGYRFGGSGGSMRRGGRQAGFVRTSDVLDAVSKAYDSLNRSLGKGVDSFAKKVLDPIADKPFLGTTLREEFQPPQKRLPREGLDIVRKRGGEQDYARWEARVAWDKASEALKGADSATIAELRDWASSRSTKFPEALKDHQQTFEGVSQFIRAIGQERVRMGRLQPEAFAQYLRYIPRMFEGMAEAAGKGMRRDVPRLDPNFMRHDGWGAVFDEKALRGIDIGDLAKQIDPHAVVTRKGGNVGVKFPEFRPDGTPNDGAQANFDSLMGRLKETFGAERAEANQAFSGAVKGQSVEGAKLAAQQRAQARRLGDVVKSTFEPLPPEVKLDLGGEVPPQEAFGAAIYRGLMDIADGKALEAIAKGSDESGPWVSDTPRQGYELMENRRLGPISGKHVRADFAEYLKGEFDKPQKELGYFDGLLQGIKSNLTVYNPAGVARQWHALPQFASMLGIENPARPEVISAFRKAQRAVFEKGGEEFKSTMREGITGRVTFPDVELAGSNSMFGRKQPPMSYRLGRATLQPWMETKTGRAVDAKLSNAYGTADRLARAFGWFYAKDHLGMSDMQAREYVNKFTQNYSEIGPRVDKLRKSYVGSPFGAFQAEKYRTLGNTFRERPLDAIQALMFRHKVKAAIAAATFMGLTGDSATDEEKKAIETTSGPQEVPINVRDDEGRPITLDTRYSDMWGDFVRRKQPLGQDSLYAWAAENTGFDISPVISLLVNIVNGKDKWGERVYNDYDSDMDKAVKSVLHTMRSYAPPLTPKMGWHARQIEAAAKGEQGPDGRTTPDLGQAILAATIGLRLKPFDVANELDRLNRQAGRAEGGFRKALLDGEMTPEEVYEKWQAMIEERLSRSTDLVNATRRPRPIQPVR